MSDPTKPSGQETRLIHTGRDPQAFGGAVNVPPFRASTILFPTLDALESHDPTFHAVRYGRTGTPGSHAFEEAVAELEGGYRAVSFGSGLAAVTVCLFAFARTGGHILVTDSAYGPTRDFCMRDLARYGVETEFYDPRIGAGIAELIRPETTLILMESPGSLTFEVQDLPAISAAARARGVTVLIDSTWAAGIYHKPLALGADVVIHAATKYMVGHADAFLGVAVCTEESWKRVKLTAVSLGQSAGADDLFLGLRGLRTLAVRLRRHEATGLALARWLEGRPEVARMLHPGLPSSPDHTIWKRDFTGASGLFAVELKPVPRAALAAMVDGLSYFGMGYSWGGFESLVLPSDPSRQRKAVPWDGKGPLIRIHAGLEEPDDLIRDLEAGFDRLNRTATP
ncbi:MAG TPA: cystathionine beta-lyase [Azospirillaceae bacterium]|nr:cystathionine beta-lyase [Azospirillaceae bacterium]